MKETEIQRRRFLVQATTVIGGAGIAASAYPFLRSMSTSARAEAAGAPLEVDISKLEPGQRVTHEWRGKPVWVISRTERMMETLPRLETQLADPQSNASQQPAYCENRFRARPQRPEIFVVVPICTHLGCVPSYRPEVSPEDLGADWLGGYFCPCHGSRYDIAARVYRNQPAPKNMEVPPYAYLDENRLLIGDDESRS